MTFTVKGKKKFRQFPKRRDAAEFVESLSLHRKEIARAEVSGPTIRTLGKGWLEACRMGRDGRPPLDPQTIRTYEGYFRNHIEPVLGEVCIGHVTREHSRSFRDDLAKAGLSRITVKKILGAWHSIVEYGVYLGHIESVPGRDVRVRFAARDARLVAIPDKELVQRFLECADELSKVSDGRTRAAWQTYRVFLLVLVGTGIRLSECRGLYREHVFPDHLIIRQRADRDGEIGPPKSLAGNRTIWIAKVVADALGQQLKSHNHQLVFPSRTGRPLDPQNLGKRFWQPLCEAAGATGYGMHSLRHYYASRLIAGGLSVKEVADALGHSDPTVTLRTYAHLFQDADSIRRRKRAAAEVFDQSHTDGHTLDT